MFDLDEVRRWITILHSNSSGYIWVGATDNMAGYTATDVEGAVNNVATLERSKPKGIYVRTTTLSRIPLEPNGDGSSRRSRGKETDSYTLPGFAGDLDIAGPGHKTTNLLPPDEATAMSIVTESGLPIPTLWVHSGGGLYPWWLLEDPVDLRDPDVLTRTKALSEKLQKVLVAAGDKLGWHVGGEVGDMARILRVPGTVNRKEGLERPCLILEETVTYEHYRYADLEQLVNSLHEAIPKPELPVYTPRVTVPGAGLSPLDDWEAKSDWEMIPGWPFELAEIRGYERRWKRIGSTSGAKWSATTGHASDRDRLYCWSPETVFEPRKPYNMQAAYVLLTQGSLSSEAFSQATRELRAQGFGGELPKLNGRVDLTSLVRPAAVAAPVVQQPMDDQQPQETALAVQANQALPVLTHDGLPSFTSEVYGTQHWDEMGLVSMYSSTFCPVLRYVNAVDEWRIWDGQRWTRDDKQRYQLASRTLMTGLLDHARHLESQGAEGGKEMVKKAQSLATMSKVMQLPKLARTDSCMTSAPSEYDRHRDLVTVDNGVLNLRTGELLDFDPKLMLTKKLNVVYRPDAQGPRTTKFLEGIQPDPAMRTYMKRLAGYTLLGNADERVLPIVYGKSGSGKSAFLEMLYHALGDFGSIADPSTLMPLPDGYQGPSEKLHSLMHARFVKMSELPENAALNQALVKSITGSDTQKTRPLYGPLVEWQVEYTVWMATNNLPKITSTDDAIWKRVKPIHFPNVFVNEDGSVKNAADKDLGRQLAREEGSFILNWLLEGIREYLEFGLQEPGAIKDGVGEYRDDMDTVRQFMTQAQEDGRIKTGEGQTITARDLYEVYMAWARDAQVRFPLSNSTFKQRMLANGYEQHRVAAGLVWKGIGIAGFVGQAKTSSSGNQWMGRMRN